MSARWAPLLLMWAASCRHPIAVDTSAARLIPRDLAVEELRGVLAKAAFAACREPRAALERREIREWAVDSDGFEARLDGRPPVRAAFKDVTSAGLEQFGLLYRVLIFTAAHPGPREEFMRIHWSKEEPARRALELIEALRQKP